MSKFKPCVSGPKPDELRGPPRESQTYPDAWAKLPTKKPSAPSVRRRRQKLSRERAG